VYAVANAATLSFTSGTRTLAAGADVTGLGTVNFGGATVNVNNAYGIAGTGATQVTSGTANFNLASALSFPNGLTISGGALGGSGAVTVNGAFNWSGGTVTGAGLLTTGASATTGITGAVNLQDKLWDNFGAVNLSSSGRLQLAGSGATPVIFTNRAGGVVTDTSSSASPITFFDGMFNAQTNKSFVNAGVFNKNAGSAATQTIDAAFANNGTFNVNTGTLTVPGPSLSGNGTIDIASGATLSTSGQPYTNTGVIQGNGTVNLGTATLTNQGIIKPGGSGAAGTLAIIGNFINSASGTIEAEVGGTAPGTQYDVIAVSGAGAGNVTLGGTLNSMLINGFVLGGQNFDTISATGTASGSFAAPNLPPGVTGLIVDLGAAKVFRLTDSGGLCTADICWIGTSGDWNAGANWSTGLVPTAGQTILINVAGLQTITVSAGAAVANQLTANENFIISGGSLILGGTSSFTQAMNITGGSLIANGATTFQSLSLSSGSAILNAASSAIALNLSGGTLGGSGNLTLSGTSTWSGGAIGNNGGGTLTIASGAILDKTAGNLALTGHTIATAGGGRFKLSGGAVFANNGAFNNAGVFEFSSDDVLADNGGVNAFNNNAGGSVVKSAGAGISGINFAANNSGGNWTVNTGTLGLNNAAAYDMSAGILTVATGATFNKNGGTFNWSGGTLAGAGNVTTSGGASFTFPGASTRVLNGPTLTLPALSLGGGSLDVQGGTLGVTGATGIAAGATLNQSGGTIAAGGAFNNNGTFNLNSGSLVLSGGGTGNGAINAAAGTTLNFSGGTFNLASMAGAAGSSVNFTGGSAGFTGAYTGGTTNVAGGTVDFGGATTLDRLALSAGTLTGAGTVNVTSSFSQSGGTQTGSGSTVLGAATALELGGATFLRAIVSNGNTTLSGGVFTLNPAVAFTTGTFNWTNGDIEGSGMLVTAGATTIAGVAPKFIASGVSWNNTGSATLSGGVLSVAGPLTNPGSLTVTDTLQLEQNFTNTGTLAVNGVLRAGAAVNAFINNGLLKGTGTIDMGGGAPAIKLTNNGTVAPGASPGTLIIIGDYEQSATGILQIELAGITQGVSYDWLNVTGNASIAGTLQVSIPGGFLPNTADAFRFVTAGLARTGTFASVVPPAGYGGGAIYGNTFTDLGFTQVPLPVNAASLNTFSATLALIAAEQSLLGNLPKQQLQILDQGLRPEEARRRDELVMLSDGCQ